VSFADRKLRGLLNTSSSAPGNAATCIDSCAVTGGSYVYNTYPEIDGNNSLGAIANFPYSAPYEDLTLKAK
jgi:hypothetical protein